MALRVHMVILAVVNKASLQGVVRLPQRCIEVASRVIVSVVSFIRRACSCAVVHQITRMLSIAGEFERSFIAGTAAAIE